jgi:hypothetical protein
MSNGRHDRAAPAASRRASARAFESAEHCAGQWRFGAAGDGDIEIAGAYRARRFPYGRAGRGAGAAMGVDRPGYPVPDRDLRGAGILHDAHQRVRLGRLRVFA